MEKEPEVRNIMQTLRPRVLRFPGGTIGNYYHPDGPGYGMRPEETGNVLPEIVKSQVQFKQNAIYHFADMCKMSDSKVLFVANMLTGTTEEMLWCLNFFKERGIEVVGVELGNEFYFRVFREQYPDAETYIRQAKEWAGVIRKYNRNLTIAVVAADPTEPNPKTDQGRFMMRWNQLLGKEQFYDTYVPHLYPKVSGCEQKGGENLKEVFECIDFTLAIDHQNYHEIIVQHYKQFYGDKKMWVTEWNVDAASTTANTLRHAAFVADFIMGMAEANAVHNNLIDLACFHNFGSGGYAAPIFSVTHNKQAKYIKQVGNIAYNSTFFPFLYLENIVRSGGVFANSQIAFPSNIDQRHFSARTFVNPAEKRVYVYFSNKSSNALSVKLGIPAKATEMQAIKGNFPWSVAGLNGFYLRQPSMVDLITEVNQKLSAEAVTVPVYSVGYLTFQLP